MEIPKNEVIKYFPHEKNLSHGKSDSWSPSYTPSFGVELSELVRIVAIADFSFEGVEKDKLQARRSAC
jgi:hypothetical protein